MIKKYLISLIFMMLLAINNAFAMDGGFCFPVKQAERGQNIIASTELGPNMQWKCDDGIMENFFYRPLTTTSQIYQMGFRIVGVYTASSSINKSPQENIPYILIERNR
ncbi:hypothetical protein IHE31_10865 [Mycetohabitans rhizoxinica]|uniref:Uncharacterized protein n=1 Tax=Mycetohabitans rhizoxinica (strain DSM 19002 / CIP 109453 / HKI 454) TaxID=882378 RepID=E5ARV0_MYCRK|nr:MULTISPECIES: hypothetical protein [Mycetohabitans]MCF7696006.1 hypothetical protein [Mycetohabitans sp. B2]MCG1047343.1 hypothetical protein [Mycetohabitans sp. B6]CBW75332.1 unnamed protein product [Mycetohabitans rhizoxinica HKI 454]